jgi:cytochrome oxidase Cu insertion factor (SCO1/SenC/PrrC family)
VVEHRDEVAPRFTLTDQVGRPFASGAQRGRVLLVNFIYTSCRDACPLLTAKLALIRRRLTEVEGLRLVSITVDPLRDTPAVLTRYAEGFGARPEGWVFLTGKATEVGAVLEAFGVTVRPGPGGSLDHTAVTVLVDWLGRRRFSYFGPDFDEAHVGADIRALLEED